MSSCSSLHTFNKSLILSQCNSLSWTRATIATCEFHVGGMVFLSLSPSSPAQCPAATVSVRCVTTEQRLSVCGVFTTEPCWALRGSPCLEKDPSVPPWCSPAASAASAPWQLAGFQTMCLASCISPLVFFQKSWICLYLQPVLWIFFPFISTIHLKLSCHSHRQGTAQAQSWWNHFYVWS